MAYITYKELTGAPVEQKAVTHDTNLVFWYAYEDLLALQDYIKTGQLTLTKALGSFFKPKAYAIWDWKDPKPAFVFLNKIVKQIFRKVFKIRKK